MKLQWGAAGQRKVETGVSKGVLYPDMGNGVAWNGLISVRECAEGGEASPLYADNMKYAVVRSLESLSGTIEAFTYPNEFAECDGSKELYSGVYFGQQQVRKPFGFSYRSEVRSADSGKYDGENYKIHIIYNAMAAPAEKTYETIAESSEAVRFSWDFQGLPLRVDGMKPVSSVTIDTSRADPSKVQRIEEILYGTNTSEPHLILPEEIIWLFRDIDPKEALSFALDYTGRWLWDPFSFIEDTVTKAIRRESLSCVFEAGEQITADPPYVIYQDNGDGRYLVTVVDIRENSQAANYVSRMPLSEFVRSYSDDGLYYSEFYIEF